MRFVCLLFAVLVVTPLRAPAQCTVMSVAFTPYGTGCNPVFATQTPMLSGRWDPQTCSVTLTITAFSGCCNTYLRDRLFVLGAQQTRVPLPFLGIGCTLWASPDIVIPLTSSAGASLTLAVPPGLPPGSIYGQGLVHYFTTIGFSDDFALTQGLDLAIL